MSVVAAAGVWVGLFEPYVFVGPFERFDCEGEESVAELRSHEVLGSEQGVRIQRGRHIRRIVPMIVVVVVSGAVVVVRAHGSPSRRRYPQR